jgi:hypothetical protein
MPSPARRRPPAPRPAGSPGALLVRLPLDAVPAPPPHLPCRTLCTESESARKQWSRRVTLRLEPLARGGCRFGRPVEQGGGGYDGTLRDGSPPPCHRCVCLAGARPRATAVSAWPDRTPVPPLSLPGRAPPCHPTKTDRRAGSPGAALTVTWVATTAPADLPFVFRQRSLSSPPVHLAETLTHAVLAGHTARNTISQRVPRAGMRTSSELQPSPGGADNARHDRVNKAARDLRPRMHAGLSPTPRGPVTGPSTPGSPDDRLIQAPESDDVDDWTRTPQAVVRTADSPRTSSSTRPRTDTTPAGERHPHPREGAVTQKAPRREVPDATVYRPSPTPWRTRRAAPDCTLPEPLRDAAAARVTTGVRSAPPRTTRTRRGQ